MDNEKNEEETLLAGICLTLDKTGNIILDTDIDDYTEECMVALAKLCTDVASDRFIYELISNIRDHLIANHKEHLLVNFVVAINEQNDAVTKLIDDNTSEEKPCVRPSDMI
jgi:hypothetical protein